MYNDFYQFRESPFNITADPEFFFESKKHSEAFSHLLYGIQQRKGILVITGEIGTGKTTLIRTLLNRLDDTTRTALILNPNFSDLQLLKMILDDLGVTGKFKNKYDYIMALNAYLLEQTAIGHNVVLIVDEAQNLGVKQLEQIRLLSNLETEKDKLLQIILVGQPELCDQLKLTSLRQLNQRISVRYHILPLTKEEVADYIRHRIAIATGPDNHPRPVFTERALHHIYELSAGSPRMVNILCDRSLLAAFTQENYTIDEQMIIACSREVQHL